MYNLKNILCAKENKYYYNIINNLCYKSVTDTSISTQFLSK